MKLKYRSVKMPEIRLQVRQENYYESATQVKCSERKLFAESVAIAYQE